MGIGLETVVPLRPRPGCGVRSALAAICLSLCVSISPVWSASLEVVASQPDVNPGGTVDVSVVISDLGDFASSALGTFDIELVYDPAVFDLQAGSTIITLLLGDELAAEALVSVTPAAGLVEVVVVSLLSSPALVASQPSSFTLFTGTFFPVGSGDATFDVAVSQIGDENGDPIPIDAVTPVVVTANSILSIPSLDAWSLGLFALMLSLVAAAALRRLN